MEMKQLIFNNTKPQITEQRLLNDVKKVKFKPDG